jgi:NADH-quinone oxidoreductase subunit C
MITSEQNKEILVNKFSKEVIFLNDKYIEINIKPNALLDTIKYLKEDSNLQYNQLIDLTAIDYPSREKRFDIVYILLSMKQNKRVLVKLSLAEKDKIQSITSIHKAADWYERECYDLFGIQFLNHPDLRRIMTDYNFEGHPLRKDFPLTGHTEVRYDELEKKVVYEPVKLTQEYRNFDYMSPWEGFENKLIGDEKSEEDLE